MALEEYKRKRDFRKTPEPEGRQRKSRGQLRFVVQKHAASHLHYDFRLEVDGVLKSWAVPKGPSLDPTVKRLAMMTEDHPIEYAEFEGIIPEGEYGGGSVIIWDEGVWHPEGDPRAGLAKGKLTFELEGTKLAGSWHLFRTGSDRGWLLKKRSDEEARPGSDLTAEEPESVRTGRTVEEVAEEKDKVWRSNRPAKKKRAARAKATGAAAAARKAIARKTPSRAAEAEPDGEDRIAGIRISHPDRVVYPEDGFTKLDVARHYELVSSWMLPQIVDRPLTLVRCTQVGEDCVFMKHSKVWGPTVIRRVKIQEKTKRGEYLVVDDVPSLIGLAQLGVIEIHTWNSRSRDLERPDRVVFDIDPDPELEWSEVVRVARSIRELLAEVDLECFVKTTGGKGIHVVVPFVPSAGWDDCFAFTRNVAQIVARRDPGRLTLNMSKAARRGKIFIDILRNSRGNTAVAAYSLRARPGAPVSLPIRWEELARVRAATYTMSTLARRLAKLREDPWAGYDEVKQKLSPSRVRTTQAKERRAG
jgi:bifunctional non-homologous end joining protein LigD